MVSVLNQNKRSAGSQINTRRSAGINTENWAKRRKLSYVNMSWWVEIVYYTVYIQYIKAKCTKTDSKRGRECRKESERQTERK